MTGKKHRKIRGVWVDWHGREIAGAKVVELNQEGSQIVSETQEIAPRSWIPLQPEMPGYNHFKRDGLNYVGELPADLTNVPGVGKKTADKLVEYFEEQGIEWAKP